MRIVIVGAGRIGWLLARALAPRHDVFVVDVDPARGERLRALDVEFVEGSGTSPDVLRRAGADAAQLLVAATRQDEVNIVACSVATRLGVRDTVCFVGKEDLLLPEAGDESLLPHFGIGRVVWPEAQLARAIERIIRSPGSVDAGAFADGRIELLELRLDAGSPLTRGPISSLALPPGVVVVAARHGDRTSIPHGGTRLEPTDRVVVMGTRAGMTRLRERVLSVTATGRRRVTIVGAGDVGWRLAVRLDRADDIDLTVIERSRERGERLAATLTRGLVLHGDGTSLALLESEDIGRSDVLVSVIDNDERNLLASLLGRQLGVGTVITRVGRPSNLSLFERVGIDVALSARGAAVEYLVHQIDGGRARLLAVLDEGQAKVLELVVPADAPATELKDLDLPPQALVAMLLRDDDALVPGGRDRIEPGDRLLICCTGEAVARLHDLFGRAS